MSSGQRRWTIERLLWWIVAAMVVATPLVIAPAGRDLFHLPKEMLFRGGWIALVTFAIAGLVWGKMTLRRTDLRNPAIAIVLACVVWAAITTGASSNPRVSLETLSVVCGSAIFFIASLKLLPGRSIAATLLVIIPALLNALVAGLQEWTELRPINLEEITYDRHLMTTGLMGNPNGVGSLLVLSILLVLAGSFATRGRRQIFMTGALVVLVFGLLASQTLTAIVATAVGGLVMTALVSWKRAVAGAAALAIIAALLVTLHSPLAQRAERLRELIAAGDYNALVTNRLTSFRAAEAMFREHPITGIGPGTFGWHYFDYKLLAQQRFPELALSEKDVQWAFNFGEVHNDHLEIAAETGFPGWILYMTALFWLGSRSFAKGSSSIEDERASLARILALPLAVAFGVLTLAQFPLQLAATRVTILFLAALCVAWSSHDD